MSHLDIGAVVNNAYRGHSPVVGHPHIKENIEIILGWWYLPDHFERPHPHKKVVVPDRAVIYSYLANHGEYTVTVAPRDRGLGEVTSILSTNHEERYRIGRLVIPVAQWNGLPEGDRHATVESVELMELQKHPICTNYWWDNITTVYGTHISDGSIQKFNGAHR